MDAQKIKSELTVIAQSRLELYRELVSLAEAQGKLLAAGRHSDLAENLKRHDPILIEIGRLDKREVALADLTPDLDPSCDYHEILRNTAETAAGLAHLTRVNAELFENAKDFVTFSIAVLAKAVNQPAASGSDSAGDSNGPILLDLRV